MGAIKDLTIDNDKPAMDFIYVAEEVMGLPLLNWVDLGEVKPVNEKLDIKAEE